MTIIVALPTIPERGDAWVNVSQVWYERTDEPIVCVPAYRPGGWCDGLNEVWELHPDADVMVLGSDDMKPKDDGWFPAVAPFLEQGCIAPQVLDPRFARFGPEVKDGDHTSMSSFPILHRKFLDKVFPMPEGLHYYGDNYISEKCLTPLGIPTIAVPSCVIEHGFDERGRGAGMGSENERMLYDRERYRALNP